MDRLTARTPEGEVYIPECFARCKGTGSRPECDECDITARIFESLASYEDNGITPEQMKEISGLYGEMCKELAGLKKKVPPCSIGDTIYLVVPDVWEVFECEVAEILNNQYGELFRAKAEERDWKITFRRKDIGKTIFLTEADLKEALEETE